MAFVLGIDIGSASSKGIVLNEKGLSGSFECPSGGDFKLTAERKDRETKLRRKYIGVEEAFKV
jgi:activator of 2-hydroxyglutaryl-CoA dehydratase